MITKYGIKVPNEHPKSMIILKQSREICPKFPSVCVKSKSINGSYIGRTSFLHICESYTLGFIQQYGRVILLIPETPNCISVINNVVVQIQPVPKPVEQVTSNTQEGG